MVTSAAERARWFSIDRHVDAVLRVYREVQFPAD